MYACACVCVRVCVSCCCPPANAVLGDGVGGKAPACMRVCV